MRSRYGTVPGLGVLLAACTGPSERVAITAHYVPACAPDVASAPTELALTALGDFDPSPQTVSVLSSGAARAELALPPTTRAVELDTLGDPAYLGTGLRGTDDRIGVLLWPETSSCSLGSSTAPAASSDAWLLASSSSARRLSCLCTTRAADAPAGLAIDLDSGQATPLAPAQGLTQARRAASSSELGNDLLIAGGLDAESGEYLANAELYDPLTQSVQTPELALSGPRAWHAALGLPSGATLLVGGESSPGHGLDSVEVVSPDAAHASRALRLLGTPRIEPAAILLDTGRILVGGGYIWSAPSTGTGSAAQRQPLSSVEFLSSDLSDVTLAPVLLEPAALDRAFVALAAGSALAVGGCSPVTTPGCISCESGTGCISKDVWWLDPEGTPHALEPLPDALASGQPRLVQAAEGAPWLVANGKLGRFDPWTAHFVLITDRELDPLDQLLAPPLPLAPGLFGWLRANGAAAEAFGLYTRARNAFTQDISPLLVGGAQGLFPHRPPVSGSAPEDVTLNYTPTDGLSLAGASAVVSIVDTDYADFTLDLRLAAGPPPVLRLSGDVSTGSQSTSFGGLGCAWPDFDLPSRDVPGSARTLRVQRVGNDVVLSLADEASGSPAPAQSVAIPCHR
ncbi:MAG TPA: hypothetical protein VG963_13975, partial [Polyangiaceae bacterium]|nr:hypothetical protein [Polyangiaceae bacterium]